MTTRQRFAFMALAVTLALLGPISAASAHEGGGTITVESSDPTGSAAVRYVVRLIWNNDGHPAAAADTTLTAVPVGTDGTAQTPVTLEPVDDDGRFAATVEFPSPGAWTVRFTAITPEANLEVPQQIDPPPPSTTSTAAPTTTSSEVATPAATEAEAPSDDEDADGTSNAGTVVFVAVLLVLAGAALLLGRRLRQRRPAGADLADAAEEQRE